MANAATGRREDLDLEHFRELLEAERSRILTDIKRLDAREEAGDSGTAQSELADYDQHPADSATETFLREQDLAIHSSLNAELHQVETASRKMDKGTYGICDRCAAEIPAERLEVLPFALYCMQCAGDLEARH